MNDRRQEHSRDLPRRNGDKDSGESHTPSAVEWLVGCIATVLVLGGIVFLAYEAWRGTALPPLVSVEARQVLPRPGGGYAVEIVAVNQGGTTARGLTIEGKLLEGRPSGAQQNGGDRQDGSGDPASGGGGGGQQGGGRVVEMATATLSWVPAHAEREGGLFFRHDPRQYRLEITPKGYDRP